MENAKCKQIRRSCNVVFPLRPLRLCGEFNVLDVSKKKNPACEFVAGRAFLVGEAALRAVPSGARVYLCSPPKQLL